MKTIGTNSIRVYHVDPSANHDGCMKAFADAGIYLWLDLDTFNSQIEQTGPHWNSTQRDAFGKVMDAFHQYDNMAGFFVGNEVLTTGKCQPKGLLMQHILITILQETAPSLHHTSKPPPAT